MRCSDEVKRGMVTHIFSLDAPTFYRQFAGVYVEAVDNTGWLLDLREVKRLDKFLRAYILSRRLEVGRPKRRKR